MEINARGSEKSLSFCCLKIDNVFCVSRLTREGGSALQYETPLECAVRELKEETGIEASKIMEIGRFVQDVYHSLYVEYLCVTDCKKNAIALQKGETFNYKWVDKKSLLEMSQDELVSSRAIKLIKTVDI